MCRGACAWCSRSCLGLCPKKAMALAAVAQGRAPLAAEVCRDDDVEAFAKAVAKSVTALATAQAGHSALMPTAFTICA
jgi:hypothetical protein